MSNKHIILAVGMVAIMVGGYLIASTIPPHGYIKAKGNLAYVQFNQGRHGRGSNYSKTIVFTTISGEDITIKDTTNTHAVRFSNEVDLAYNPRNPKQVIVLSDSFSKRFWGGTLLLMGGAFLYWRFKR